MLFVALLLCSCGRCGSKDPPADWIARVASFSGKVTVTPGGGKAAAVRKGQFLRIGDRLETGAKSEAVLALRSKRNIRVRPNSVVLLRSRSSASGLSLALEQGSVTAAASEVAASELTIAVGKKRILLASAAQATVAVPGDGTDEARIEVSLGEATVEGPGGASRTIVAGQELVLDTSDKPPVPDAAPAKPDAGVAPAGPQAFFLQRVGRGRVLIKPPDAKRFQPVRRRKWIDVAPGTVIRLLRRARARFGADKESAMMLAGPGTLRVREQGGADGASPLEHVAGDIVLSHSGEPGSSGSSFTIEGVTITPKVRHKEVDVRIRRKGNRHAVVVRAGQAELKGKKDKAVLLEAGQEATINAGNISAPRMPAQAPFQIRHFGTVRVFTSDVKLPVTFKWKLADSDRALVEVSRFGSMARPLFSDIIKRRVLTIPEARRGNLFWRVSPVDGSGKPGEAKKGRLILVRDTSYRVLKNYRPPRNTIHESFGNTTVYYQNRLPRFTFRWNPIEGASKYTLKIFREQNLQKPLVNTTTKKPRINLKPGKLGEGTYIWYVAGRSPTGELVRALKGRKLSVRYDNATPDLQIVYPRNGITVGEGAIEAKGVTIPGSKVFVNGKEAELDKGFRFTHAVALKPGVNYITFRVVARRRGSSFYLRRVTRK